MDMRTENQRWFSAKPFSELAARYSLIVPFATLAVSFVLVKFGQLVFHEADAIVDSHTLDIWTFGLMLSSFLAGIVSLFGVFRHGTKAILWRSSIGIIVSLYFGVFSLLSLAYYGHGRLQ